MKPRWKILLNYTVWGALLLTLVLVLGAVGEKQQQMRCKSLEVVIFPETENFFVTRDDIVKIVTGGEGENTFKGKPMIDFDVSALEAQLELNPYIKNAEVFMDIEGNLRVEAWQRNPIVRVAKSSGKGFYIDEEGIKMPLSPNYTAHVPIATGKIQESVKNTRDTVSTTAAKEVYQLAKYLNQNPFWQAMVEQIIIDQNNELVLIPVVANHKIVLGDLSRLDEKLKHLKIFYKKGLNKIGWEKYKVINLKYTGQIVCEKY